MYVVRWQQCHTLSPSHVTPWDWQTRGECRKLFLFSVHHLVYEHWVVNVILWIGHGIHLLTDKGIVCMARINAFSYILTRISSFTITETEVVYCTTYYYYTLRSPWQLRCFAVMWNENKKRIAFNSTTFSVFVRIWCISCCFRMLTTTIHHHPVGWR